MYILEVFHVHMITYMYVHTGGISCTHDYIHVCTYMEVFHVHMITYMYVHTGGISCTHDYIVHTCMYILEVFHVHMITYMYVHTGGISCTHDYIHVCTYWRYFMYT